MSDPVDEFGVSISEWIEGFPAELPYDGVALFQLINGGRDAFFLQGQELRSFVARGIRSLLEAGAVPAIPAITPDQKPIWVEQLAYGTTTEERIDRILAEWEHSGVDPDPFEGLWFALMPK